MVKKQLKRLVGAIKRHKRIAAAICVILVLLTAAAAMLPQGVEVQTAAAELAPVQDWYKEEGKLTSGDSREIVSKVSGTILMTLVEENSRVKAGDTILVIDSRDYEYEKEQMESTVSSIQAQIDELGINNLMMTSPQEYLGNVQNAYQSSVSEYEQAATEYQAAETLYAAQAVSLVEYEAKKAAYESARAAMEQAKARYEESRSRLESLNNEGVDEGNINEKFYASERNQLQAELESGRVSIARLEDRIRDCTITADRDGVVTSLPVKDRTMIQSGETAVVLSGSGKIGGEADVLTTVAPYIRVGTQVQAVVKQRGKNEKYSGKVSKINDFAREQTSALGLTEYRVHVDVELDGELSGRDGYGADMKFLLYDNDNALTVPVGAVFESGEKDYVYTIQGGKAVKTEVQVAYQTASVAVVGSGLSEGDRVISPVSSKDLYDGAKVKVVNSN